MTQYFYPHQRHSAEILHNCEELKDYLNQIEEFFDLSQEAQPLNTVEQDALSSVSALAARCRHVMQQLAALHFPLLQSPRHYHLLSARSRNVSQSEIAEESAARCDGLISQIQHLNSEFSSLFHPGKIPLGPMTPQILQQYQQVAFDIDLQLSGAVTLDRDNINRAVHANLLTKFPDREIWTPHIAEQKAADLFELLHLICSQLQSLVRLKTTHEQGYTDALARLFPLSAILCDFEQKLIGQKRAEKKRLDDLGAQSVSQKKGFQGY